MASIIGMPKLSDTMEEGGIAGWLKKEGEKVEEGESFVEIETDKATMEYQAPDEGVILKILVEPGKTVPLDTPIAVIGAEGETWDPASLPADAPAAAPAPEPAASPAPQPAASPAPQPSSSSSSSSAPSPAPAAEAPGLQLVQGGGDGRTRSSPLARRLAAEKGIDIARVQGTGPGGRVVLRDVENLQPAAAAGAASAGTLAAGLPAETAPGAAVAGDADLPVNMMRKTIAKRLLAGKNEAPHFYLTVSADMTRLLDWRKKLNKEAAERPDEVPKVSVNDLLMMVTARALRRHPEINASWQGDVIRRFGAVHMAMAVALPEGLITPVIRNACTLGVREVATASRAMARKAREGGLTPEDYSGGTFTISNLGMLGIEEFTAIINPPQAAILAVAKTMAVPWVNGDGDVVVCPRMKMTMSCDHRVIDGAMGAGFLQTLVAWIEDPLLVLS